MVMLTGWAIDRVDTRGSIADKVELARVPLRNGEFGVVVLLTGAAASSVMYLLTDVIPLTVATFLATPAVANVWLNRRIAAWAARFEDELPGALSMIASSLTAGHTFLRALQHVSDELTGPVGDEFTIVLHETELGASLSSAIQRLAFRVDTESVRLLADAVRIQHQAGGSMAELLHDLADFLRARDELDREVRVLTAEGRVSAGVLGSLPVFLLVAMQVVNPGYAAPLWSGWGLAVLGGCAASVAIGVSVILRISRIAV